MGCGAWEGTARSWVLSQPRVWTPRRAGSLPHGAAALRQVALGLRSARRLLSTFFPRFILQLLRRELHLLSREHRTLGEPRKPKWWHRSDGPGVPPFMEELWPSDAAQAP